jgi:hypothetical protein
MLSKTEIEFLKNPERFDADYRRVMRHRVKAKAEEFRAQIALLQGCGALEGNGLSVTENCNGVTEFCNGQENKQGLNQAAFLKTKVEVGAFGGIWTRDHYLTKVTPHRTRLRRRFSFSS